MNEHIFNRGFFISSISNNKIKEIIHSSPNTKLSKFRKTFFGPYTLWHDESLKASSISDNKYGVMILGLCINPIEKTGDKDIISKKLFHTLKSSNEDFFTIVNQLSGTFSILYRINSNAYLINDAAGCKPVYFTKSIDGITASSHAAIISIIHNKKKDEVSEKLINKSSYKKDPSRYIPGIRTPFEDIHPLIANNLLDLQKGELFRFYPTKPIISSNNILDTADEIFEIMRSQAKILESFNTPLNIATTGGRDSRVSVSFYSKLHNSKLFSFHSESSNHLSKDVEIARIISSDQGCEINIYNLDQYRSPEFLKEFYTHSPLGIWPSAAKCYLINFPNESIHIRSTISEIGRVFYKNRTYPTTANSLAQCYTNTEFKHDTELIGELARYIDYSNFNPSDFFNIDPYDLFYWEHRNSKWQNILCMEAEMASDVFIPFNNRHIIEKLLSVPIEDRINAKLHKMLWTKASPSLDKIPIA